MHYFILAGEASGDLHGSGLVEAIRQLDSEAEIDGWGGEKMEQAGARILKHYRDLAFMGFIEVARNILTIRRNFQEIKKTLKSNPPDALILIDYPGFNLRMARWANRWGIPVHYYISPQVWAWKENRVEIVRKFVDQMYVILPFEELFYQQHGIEVTYVGHPLLEAIEKFKSTHVLPDDDDRRIIALLAGSRQQEVKHMLPTMLEVAEAFPKYHFRIAAAPQIPLEFYRTIVDKSPATNVDVRQNETYAILQSAYACLTTSGTATLETALFGVPQVVCYKGNALSFQIAKRLVKVPFISLVNLIAGKPVVEELIQENLNSTKLAESFETILQVDARRHMQEDYAGLISRLDRGGASRQVAKHIIEAITNHGNI